MVFKEAADRRKLAGDACKLCTGTSARPIITSGGGGGGRRHLFLFLPLAGLEEKDLGDISLHIHSSIKRSVADPHWFQSGTRSRFFISRRIRIRIQEVKPMRSGSVFWSDFTVTNTAAEF
jgi:hypothetical protein